VLVGDFDYDAFISYKRSDGTRAARWLRRRLVGYRLPRSLRAQWPDRLTVYLDTIYEHATEDFFENNIKLALRRSRYFILVITPAMLADQGRAESWVERELQEFTATEQRQNVIAVMAPGLDETSLPSTLAEKYPRLEIVTLKDLTTERFWRWSKWWSLSDELLKITGPLCRIATVDMPRLRGEERNRTLRILGVASAVLGVILVGMTVLASVAYRNYVAAENSRRSEHAAQVRALLDAHPQAVPDIIKSLPAESDVLEQLQSLWHQPSNDGQRPAVTRAGLALHALAGRALPEVRSRLLDWMAEASDPQEVLLIRGVLSRDPAGLAEDLWKKAEAPQTDREQRLRVLVALAAFDPSNARWTNLGTDLAATLVQANSLHLAAWADAFRPVKAALIEPLIAHFSDRSSDGRRYSATTLLATYGAESTELIVRLLETADATQYATVFPLLDTPRHRESAIRMIRQRLAATASVMSPPGDARLPGGETAKARAHLAVALLRLAGDQDLWALLKQGAEPAVRSHLVHALGPLGTEAAVVLERLRRETDVFVRRSLILSLGEFSAEQLTPAQRQETVALLLEWYRTDPDPGVHSAVDWLLGQSRRGPSPRALDWRAQRELRTLDQRLMGDARAGRNWFVNQAGQTMAIVRGPSTTWLAASEGEKEGQFRKQIRRTFAVATKEVTVAQFREFRSEWPPPEVLKYVPDDDGPVLGVTWFEAAEYANWLSRREGRPLCYTMQLAGTAMNVDPNLLSRPCYRLPTEAEWEAVTRAGSAGSRFYGESADLLGEYAWYQRSSDDRAWPVGQLKPNDLGLFDVYGNAAEWTQDRAGDTTTGTLRSDAFLDMRRRNAMDDEEDSRPAVPIDSDRVMKGGSFNEREARVRSDGRNYVKPGARTLAFGFRLALTLGGRPTSPTRTAVEASSGASLPRLQLVVDHKEASYRSDSLIAWPQPRDVEVCLGRLQYDKPVENGLVVVKFSPNAPELERLPFGLVELSIEPPTTSQASRDVGLCLRDILRHAVANRANSSATIPFRVVESPARQ
jgi:formylglycine-generating enzyme required for sulfatase activity